MTHHEFEVHTSALHLLYYIESRSTAYIIAIVCYYILPRALNPYIEPIITREYN